MNPKQLAHNIFVSPQLSVEDVAEAKSLGFRFVIVNRPDGEESDQPSTAEIKRAALDAGMGFAAIPVQPGIFTDEAVRSFGEILATLDGPALAYCRTGVRAASLWALSTAPTIGADNVIATAREAGYDLHQLKSRLENKHV